LKVTRRTPVRITVLADNSAGSRGLVAEHGLALWIELGDHRVLFDTGQGLALGHNAGVLGVDLATTEAVALSHGHYDHTGGLGEVMRLAGRVRTYAHAAAFADKYARNPDGTSRDIGLPGRAATLAGLHGCVALIDGPAEIVPGIHLTGPVPRVTTFEDPGGPFFLDPGCSRPDLIVDDQAAYIDTHAGSVVLLGCGHAGMINTLLYIQTLTDNRPIRSVIGGMHLRTASDERVSRTIRELERLGSPWLHPCHCTGFTASARLWHAFPDRCTPCTVGTVLAIDDDGSDAARLPDPGRQAHQEPGSRSSGR
jgi:7,8-dihydropterin-6-yl-methyl-4-(beta-D-ribofuranosyl)aminobenzene 5'-phosphate synthase